jgi:hypothetical protein
VPRDDVVVTHACEETRRSLSGRQGRRAIVIPNSTITCPACGTGKAETMSTDACRYLNKYTDCGELLHPKSRS